MDRSLTTAQMACGNHSNVVSALVSDGFGYELTLFPQRDQARSTDHLSSRLEGKDVWRIIGPIVHELIDWNAFQHLDLFEGCFGRLRRRSGLNFTLREDDPFERRRAMAGSSILIECATCQ